MAAISVKSVALRGIVSSLPARIVRNSDFNDVFKDEDIAKTAKMSGVQERRYTDDDTCTSDLCTSAAEALLAKIGWDAASVDGLIFVSQTPDYRLPATSAVIHRNLGLSIKCAAFDVNQGCSGYVYGLWLASCMVQSGSCKRVLLLVGDTCTKFVSKEDKATALLFGDAGTATALESDHSAPPMTFVLGTDGSGANHLIIPGGGYREKSSMQTLAKEVQSDGSVRSKEDLYMNGAEIFNFTISEVPKLVQATLDEAGQSLDGIDAFVFHQANEFMVNHIAKKLKLPKEKVPYSITLFGNTSSASIPLTICAKLEGAQAKKLLLAGFGVGYSWAGAMIQILEGCPTIVIEYRGKKHAS